MYDVTIVGSGAAGAWTAYQLSKQNLHVQVIDVGNRNTSSFIYNKNLYDIRKNDTYQFDFLIGNKFESLHNIHQPYLTPKLKSPRFRYVIKDSDKLCPIQRKGFSPLQSFSYGGLANAWGAGAYRYTDQELNSFLIKTEDLDKYYNEITDTIGICGAVDDLTSHFGSAYGLQQPLKPDVLTAHTLASYERQREYFINKGIQFGRPRLAILNEKINTRSTCQYDNLSFWEPGNNSIYTPAITMDMLRENNSIKYKGGCLAIYFFEDSLGVGLVYRNLASGSKEFVRSRKLILAAGALGSAKLVLRSYRDYKTALPLLENPTSLVPFLNPLFVGHPVQKYSHGLIQLNILYRGVLSSDYVQGSFYNFTSPLTSDVIQDFPFSGKANLLSCKYLLPALSIIQFFYSEKPHPLNYVRLTTNNHLITSYQKRLSMGEIEQHFICALRRMFFFSHSRLIQYPGPGNGIHYAGTLPMSDDKSIRYRTTKYGRLAPSKNVYVTDGAIFPWLPAKNHTMTIMANAMRVAAHVAEKLKAEKCV
jgi:choline dehydrogenase-like flavoprotein